MGRRRRLPADIDVSNRLLNYIGKLLKHDAVTNEKRTSSHPTFQFNAQKIRAVSWVIELRQDKVGRELLDGCPVKPLTEVVLVR